MLTKIQIARLKTHLIGIFQTLILPEINPEGYILVQDTDGSVYEDHVTTHHLVDFCLELNPSLTSHIVKASCEWFIKNRPDFQNPFTITTLAMANRFTEDEKNKIIENILIDNQRRSGYIDLYAAFLDGGSQFSTLWAIKIIYLLKTKNPKKDLILKSAFSVIEKNWEDLHRISFKGFYCELKWLIQNNTRGTEVVLKEILSSQNKDGLWDKSLVYTAYLIGNLSNIPRKLRKNENDSICKGLKILFDLDSEAKEIPKSFLFAQRNFVNSLYIQYCLRALISGIRYLKNIQNIDITNELSAAIFGFVPRVYQNARIINGELKRMNDQYGDIQNHFEHLEQSSKEILLESPYDKNVFVMMPFRQQRDERYESIEKAIRTTLEKFGYRAWLAADKTVKPLLWDNVSTFLLACKYGIAIFTRVEKERQITVDEFNPNVSLELGFYLSRGKKVLILKDKILPKLPTDLVGHLYEEFDLNQSSKEIPKIVRKWISQINKKKA